MQLKLPTAGQLVEMKQRALEIAAKRLGARPTAEDLHLYRVEITTYPLWFAIFSGVLLLVVLVASGYLSYNDINSSVTDIKLAEQIAAAGTAVFLLAEFVFIVSTLTRKVFGDDNRRAITLVGWVGLVIAFTGNWIGVNPSQHAAVGDIIFSALVALMAPTGTLASSLIFENMLTSWVHGKELARRKLEDLQKEWDKKAQTLEDSPDHRNAWASEIWHWMTTENVKGRGATLRGEYLAGLSENDRYRLVAKIMSRLDWFTTLESRDGHDGQTDTNLHEDTLEDQLEGESSDQKNRHDEIFRHLGVMPPANATTQERLSMLAGVAYKNPSIFDRYTRDALAEHFGISTGSVSNVKREVMDSESAK